MRKFNKTLKYCLLLTAIITLFASGFSSYVFSNESEKANISISIGELKYQNIVKVSKLQNNLNKIVFGPDKYDYSGGVLNDNLLTRSNLDFYIRGEIINYKFLHYIDTSISYDSSELFESLIQKGYIQSPKFELLERTNYINANPTKIGSFWCDEQEQINDARKFIIKSAFTWGSFFNYMNPSLFFDSNLDNGIKKGNEYSKNEIVSILGEIAALNNEKFTITLHINLNEFTI